MWDTIQETIVKHFTSADRRATVSQLMEMTNFLEGWFTGECLIALHNQFPDADLWSNANYQGFAKPDISFAIGGNTCVMAVKHIATFNRDARSRWDGGKDSTVAKDIYDLSAHPNQ